MTDKIEEQRLKLKLFINDLPIDSDTEKRLNDKIEQLKANEVLKGKIEELYEIPPNPNFIEEYLENRLTTLTKQLKGE